MTLSYPDPRRRRPRFELPGSAGAGPRHYPTIALISHASKVMLKILQARLQQYVNCELPDVQAGFRKGRGTRDNLPTSVGSQKKQKNSRKLSTSASLTILKALCGSQLK